jgi:hypothetical protein
MAEAMVTAGEINAAAGYQPTRQVSSGAFAQVVRSHPRLDPWRMPTREVKGHLSLRSRSRCRWGSAGDLLRIGLPSGQQGLATSQRLAASALTGRMRQQRGVDEVTLGCTGAGWTCTW